MAHYKCLFIIIIIIIIDMLSLFILGFGWVSPHIDFTYM